MLGTCTPHVANSAPATKNWTRRARTAARRLREGAAEAGIRNDELPFHARQSGARQSARVRIFEREGLDALDPTAQRQRAEVVGTDFGRRDKDGEGFGRCDEEASDFAG